jgi:hypothetical protein
MNTPLLFTSSLLVNAISEIPILDSTQIRTSSMTIGSFDLTSTIGPDSDRIRLALTEGDAYKPTGATWNIVSDERLKTEIQVGNTHWCYSRLRQLRLYRFTFVSSFLETSKVYDKHVLGFLAQEVSTLVPKAVYSTRAYGFNDFLTLNTDQLEMIKVGALQKVIQEKEEMESTALTLVSLNSDATARLSTLESRIFNLL